MVKKILNYLGEEIGELPLPDDTPEEVWQKILDDYAKPPPVTFEKITPRQIRLGLVKSGVSMDMIDSALSQLPEPAQSIAKIEWEYATFFERDKEMINVVGSLVGMSSDDVDRLWRLCEIQ